MRILMWLALGVLVLFALRKQAQRTQSPKSNHQQAPKTASETMVACTVCSVFIPESEAIVRHGQTYCCEDHASRSA
ncbi:MAG: hypothetical protein E6Q34_04440 [Burkholderiaceae bacterium]|nr:MAG: hypothetical protein E6Q34_04440 [Burkholderiaceae bacterium]